MHDRDHDDPDYDGRDDQVVRLPEEFRLPGTEVTLSRSGNAVRLEPVRPKMSREEFDAIFAKLRSYYDDLFMPEGREQLTTR